MQKIKSRYGVYYDMSQSPYQYHDGKTGYVLYFSSRFNRERFEKYLPECLRNLINRTECVGVGVDCTAMSLFMAYTTIEGRGFYVRNGEKVYNAPYEVVV